MPSKRKKNKRRMRRVQAQRRALEEQYASSGKGTPGVCAVSAPVPARVPVPKTSECPVAVPIPLAVVTPVDVPVEVPPAEPVPLEVPVTDAVRDEVVKAAEDLRQTPAEPPTKEPAVIEEDESVAISVSEVTSSIDEPVSIPAESENHVLASLVETVDAEHEVEVELPAEDPVVDVSEPEGTVTTAHTVAAEETVTETVVSEAEGEPAADTTVEVDGHVPEVVGEPAVEAEAITAETEPAEVHTVAEVTEDVHAEPVTKPEPEEFPVEAAVPTEALVEPEPEPEQPPIPLEEPTPLVESTSEALAEESVVTELILSVDTTEAEEQIPDTADAPEVLSETIPAPEPLPLPVPVAKEIIQAQDEFMPQVETETIKDLAVAGSRNVDAINGCLGVTEVAIEG